MKDGRPRITSSNHVLSFDKLSFEAFEQLALWLVNREGFTNVEHLGAGGNEQGRDIVGQRDGKLWAFQCKRVRRFSFKNAEEEIKKILSLKEAIRPQVYVFLVTTTVTAATRQKIRDKFGAKLEFHFWAETELVEMVKRHPSIVDEFFVRDIKEIIEVIQESQSPRNLVSNEDAQTQAIDPTVLIVDLTESQVANTILECAQAQSNVLSFPVDNAVFDPADTIPIQKLHSAIVECQHSYMHLVFVTEGQGVDLVARLLLDDFEASDSATVQSLTQAPNLIARTRAIVDFGSSLAPSARQQEVRADMLSTEENRLANDLRKAFDLLKKSDLPRPRFICMTTESRGARNYHKWRFAEHEEMYETITELPIEQESETSSDRFRMVAKRIRTYLNSPDMLVSYITMRRLMRLDGEITPTSTVLCKSVDAQQRWHGQCGDQQKTLESLTTCVRAAKTQLHPQTMITGPAGVGKSTVLRRLARHLASRYLEGHRNAPLAMLVPMQSVSLSATELAAIRAQRQHLQAREAIYSHWVTLVNEVVADSNEENAFVNGDTHCDTTHWSRFCLEHVTKNWLTKRMVSSSVVLMLDGIDEFTVNHGATVETVNMLFDALGKTNAGSPSRIRIVFTVRDSLPAISELAIHNTDCFEILPVDVDEAERMWPGTKKILKILERPSLERLVLSPLILLQLGPNVDQIPQDSPLSRSQLLMRALHILVSQSKTPKMKGTAGWIPALSIVAWILFRGNYGSVEQSLLKTAALELENVWVCADELPGTLKEGFQIIGNDDTLQSLVSRTVLNTLGRQRIRFRHREWQDILVADYLAQAILRKMPSQLNYRVFSKQIYRDAAELLCHAMREDRTAITLDWLEEMLSIDSQGSLVLPNLCAVVGNGPIRMSQPSFGKLIELITTDECPEITRLIAISSFGMRMLRADRHDESFPFMQDMFLGALRDMERSTISANRVSASMAWCYRAEIEDRNPAFKRDVDMAWPGLSAVTPEGIAAVAVGGSVWVEAAGGVQVTPRCRSFQIASAQYPLDVKGIPFEEISLTHYLFVAAASVKRGAASSEIYPLLRSVFAKETGVADRVNRHARAEVQELFSTCRLAVQELIMDEL